MTGLSKRILGEFQIRKTAKQKRAFRELITEELSREGYSVKTEEARFVLKNHNLVIGDPDTAWVVFAAHYDTCAVMPFPNFITPKCVPLYLVYQLVLVAVIIALSALFALVPVWLGADGGIAPQLAGLFMLALCALMMAGPANKHTANDNTSGVITVIETALALPKELRPRCAFVLFDNEELGLFGSAGFAKKHPAVKKGIAVMNFDCVSDGNTMMLLLPNACPPKFEEHVRASYASSGEKAALITGPSGVFYPSDQGNFKLGVGVAALKSTKRGLMYIDRIHTNRDTAFDEANIAFLARGSVELAARL